MTFWKERRYHGEGLGGGGWQERVFTVEAGEAAPEGAEKVAQDTPTYDWRHVDEAGAVVAETPPVTVPPSPAPPEPAP